MAFRPHLPPHGPPPNPKPEAREATPPPRPTHKGSQAPSNRGLACCCALKTKDERKANPQRYACGRASWRRASIRARCLSDRCCRCLLCREKALKSSFVANFFFLPNNKKVLSFSCLFLCFRSVIIFFGDDDQGTKDFPVCYFWSQCFFVLSDEEIFCVPFCCEILWSRRRRRRRTITR